MKKFASKSLVAVAMVAAMGISVPAVAFAGSTTTLGTAFTSRGRPTAIS
jgi:thymidine phosphorylase